MTAKNRSSRFDFLSPVSEIPGFGGKRSAALRESGIETIGDLLYHFPLRYVDRSVITPAGELARHIDQTCTVIGTITRTRVEQGRRPRLRIQVEDASGSVEALFFQGITFFRKTLFSGKRVVLHGKVTLFTGCQMVHPSIESIGPEKTSVDIPYLPLYPLSMAMRDAGIRQKNLFTAIRWALVHLKHFPQILPQAIESKKRFPELVECLTGIHFPSDPGALKQFFDRLRYEELYQLALNLRWSRRKFALPGRSMNPGAMTGRFLASLPFTLTDEQQNAISVLHADAASAQRMHRLLQGDVGCGKTIVAFIACFPALNEGFQAAWLAPTEVLAIQTHTIIAGWLAQFGIVPALLTGSTQTAERRKTLASLQCGEVKCIVGTHALLQATVKFARLGMIVIDEQHKFGSQQRLTFQQKDPSSDFLVMSATPIPQTLAKTLYGDLDVVSIRGLPRGRQKVHTHVVPESRRQDMERFIKKMILETGCRVFYVVPRIDSVDEETPVRDAGSVCEELKNNCFAGIPIACVHGKIDPQQRSHIMREVASGAVKICVATTVVEVGIDIPEASIIVIENAERFGLSQLHQLRGRVGRGCQESYAFLLTSAEETDAAFNRLKRFCAMHDGFAIADLDLSLRGPGEVAGYRQSGWDELKIADILRDSALFREIQEEIDTLLASG